MFELYSEIKRSRFMANKARYESTVDNLLVVALFMWITPPPLRSQHNYGQKQAGNCPKNGLYRLVESK